MRITEEQVRHVALLSRLQLTDAEVAEYTRQLGAILGHIEKLNALDTSKVEPMLTASASGNVFRPDVEHKGLPRADAFASAPSHDDEYFRVPAVIE